MPESKKDEIAQRQGFVPNPDEEEQGIEAQLDSYWVKNGGMSILQKATHAAKNIYSLDDTEDDLENNRLDTSKLSTESKKRASRQIKLMNSMDRSKSSKK